MMSERLCTELVQKRAVSFDPSLGYGRGYYFYPCEYCGSWTSRPERHHRKFRSRGGIWIPSNVILLCAQCHRDATDEAPWVSGTGLNVHSFEEPDEVPVFTWYAGTVLFDDEGRYTQVDKG